MKFSMKNLYEWVEQSLSPEFLEIIDESSLHKGHAGVRGARGDITHIFVRIRAMSLQEATKVKQHQMLYSALKPAIEEGLHAMRFEIMT